ncbi:hypothetical protein RFI_38631, partial [Reticulomyxa filosa]
NCWVRRLCRQIFGIIFTQLNEQQKDDLFEFLSNGFNNKSGDILQSYSDTLQKIVLQLNKTQLNKLFDCLRNKLNTMNNDVEIEKRLSELNKLDPDDFFMWRTNNKDYDSYIRVLRKIALQLDETKLDEFFQFLKERFDHCNGYVFLSYVKIFETISSKFNKRQMDSLDFLRIKEVSLNLDEQQLAHLLRYVEDGIKNYFVLDVTPFKKKVLQLDGTRLRNLFQEGFNYKDYRVWHSYVKLLESIASELNEQQTRSTFELLLKGLNNKYADIRCLCVKVLRGVVSKLSGTQLHNLLSILKEKFNHYEVQYLRVKILEKISCTKILQTISPKLNNEQIDSLLQYLGYGFNHGDDSTHNSCTKISPKLNTEQINSLLQCLENGFNDGDDSIHNSCAKILQTISPKLNNEQLSNILQCLSNRFNLNDDNLQNSSQKIFGIITARLKKGALNETVEYLKYESKNYDIQSWILCTKIMSSISNELNERQLDITFKSWMDELSYIKTLQMIALELNETQLNNLLHYLQKSCSKIASESSLPYEQVLEIVLSNLNDRKINTFKILMDGLNNINYEVRNLYVN